MINGGEMYEGGLVNENLFVNLKKKKPIFCMFCLMPAMEPDETGELKPAFEEADWCQLWICSDCLNKGIEQKT
jgi:hypothetical protein